MLELIRSFWNFPGGMPINYPFWFLRDLMIMVVFAPIVFAAVKCGKCLLSILLLGLWVYKQNLFPDNIPSYSAITFFTLGASFSILNWDFASFANKALKYVLPLWILVICVMICVHSMNVTALVSPVASLMGMVVYLALASRVRRGVVVSFLASSSFFIYAFHGIPIQLIINVMISMLRPANDLVWVITFFSSFVIVVSLSLMVYYILSKYLPKLTAVVTGGR